MEVITRFAPSSTGHLHLGHAYSAWMGWQRARISGGSFLVRLEDIDSTRCKPEYVDFILEDLRWLGLEWDGDIRMQSDYLPDYSDALSKLNARGVLYPCFCSRSEIARALAAPHGGEQKYPGTCRHLSLNERNARLANGHNYALRLNVELALEAVRDFGFYEEDIGYIDGRPETLGDVVLGRRDHPVSYHLCVVHDDAVQKISHVTRGQDLFDATHTHVLLQRLLACRPRPMRIIRWCWTPPVAGWRSGKAPRHCAACGRLEYPRPPCSRSCGWWTGKMLRCDLPLVADMDLHAANNNRRSGRRSRDIWHPPLNAVDCAAR